MKAQVIGIESDTRLNHRERFVMVKFDGGTGIYDRIRIPIVALIGLPGGAELLDAELRVTFELANTIPIDAPGVTAIQADLQNVTAATEAAKNDIA